MHVVDPTVTTAAQARVTQASPLASPTPTSTLTRTPAPARPLPTTITPTVPHVEATPTATATPPIPLPTEEHVAQLPAWAFLLAISILGGCGFVGWQIARQTRSQQEAIIAQMQMRLSLAVAASRPREDDPLIIARRLVTRITGRLAGTLTPLRGSVSPTYLCFLENDERKLLLAARSHLAAALDGEGVSQSRWPWDRQRTWAVNPLTAGVLVQEEITQVWTSLAATLNLPDVAPPVEAWTLVALPLEEPV